MGAGTNPSADVLQARRILRDSAPATTTADRVALAKRLKDDLQFSYARQLFARLHQKEPCTASYRTNQALCTYKDPELPVELRLDAALEVLGTRPGGLDAEDSYEALGIAGAIHKAKWAWDARASHLDTSLEYYERGRQREPQDPDSECYCAINAAFVLDLLASLDPAATTARRAEADVILEEVIAALAPRLGAGSQWWPAVTLLEAQLGLARFDDARATLRHVPAITSVKGWELETTVRQLVTRARLRYADQPQREHTMALIAQWLGHGAPGIGHMDVGKVGMALSGGGFRASLFHLGVLACLADRDVLRHVQVLSCVSGGSIAGAQYYLRLRERLETTNDVDVTREHYQEVVTNVIADFRAAVGTNIRVRLLSDPWCNVELLATRGGSRTKRVAQLLDSKLHSRVDDTDGIAMRDLRVSPAGDKGFRLQADNWKRAAKVPVLILNATTLNTGHVWQFTASTLGEPANPLSAEVEKSAVLRRAWYGDLPPEWQEFRLADAVAASACVPGLFAPLVLRGMYPGYTVKLVDGGVHDNQGIAGLIGHDCSVMIVSDASGQMRDVPRPRGWIPRVLGRSSKISMARIRAVQYDGVQARVAAGVVRSRHYVHLRSGLDRETVLVDGEVPDELLDGRSSLTDYDVNVELQRSLAEMRTDLDSFSDVEAFALMESGYRQMRQVKALGELPPSDDAPHPWPFRVIGQALERADPPEKLAGLLKMSSQQFLRPLALLGVPGSLVARAPAALFLGALLVATGGLLAGGIVLTPAGWGAPLSVLLAFVVLLPLLLVGLARLMLLADLLVQRQGSEKHIDDWT